MVGDTEQNGIFVTGKITFRFNKFIGMPRGRLSMSIVGHSKFTKDANIEYKELVFKVQKPISKENDRLLYFVKQEDIKDTKIQFDTFYFDDFVKLDVFHKNSFLTPNMTGKSMLPLSHPSFDPESLFSLPIYNKKLQRTVGYVYLKLDYTPRDSSLFDPEWLLDIGNV